MFCIRERWELCKCSDMFEFLKVWEKKKSCLESSLIDADILLLSLFHHKAKCLIFNRFNTT